MYDDDIDIYADYKQDIEYKNKLLNDMGGISNECIKNLTRTKRITS